MKPTYEHCNFCNKTTQHLNGYCSCYESTKEWSSKIIKTEHYNTSPETLAGIKDLQTIYNKIKSNV